MLSPDTAPGISAGLLGPKVFGEVLHAMFGLQQPLAVSLRCKIQ